MEIPRGKGVEKGKCFKEKYGAQLELLEKLWVGREEGVQTNKPSRGGGVQIFSGRSAHNKDNGSNFFLYIGNSQIKYSLLQSQNCNKLT